MSLITLLCMNVIVGESLRPKSYCYPTSQLLYFKIVTPAANNAETSPPLPRRSYTHWYDSGTTLTVILFGIAAPLVVLTTLVISIGHMRL
jgi:hypothetical protein